MSLFVIKKGAENLAADQLSRLENPHQGNLEKKEITKTIPLETLGMIYFRGDSSTPWFVDIANYHAGNFIMATNAQNTNNTSIRYEKKMKFMEQSIGPAPDPETTNPDTIDKFLALGWHLEEIHVTWAHLEKKRTRLRLYTIYLEELCIQSMETASQASSNGVRIFMVTASRI
ncbi:hypothetical protein Tco_0935533 [Tanacetum coccineum]